MNMIPISGISPMSPLFGEEKKAVEKQSGVPFADILKESMQNLQEAQAVSQQDAYDLAMGQSDDLHTIAIHSAQATAALELTVQVASRAVTAYKEILQMQI